MAYTYSILSWPSRSALMNLAHATGLSMLVGGN